MIGSDKVGHWDTYPEEITKYYPLLERLSTETATKLCSDNILVLIHEKEAQEENQKQDVNQKQNKEQKQETAKPAA